MRLIQINSRLVNVDNITWATWSQATQHLEVHFHGQHPSCSFKGPEAAKLWVYLKGKAEVVANE